MDADAQLEAMGIVSTRHGSGTFVTDLSAETLARPLIFVLDIASAVTPVPPLAKPAGALIGRLLRGGELGDHVGRTRRPAEPHTGKEGLREGPHLQHDVRRKGPQRR